MFYDVYKKLCEERNELPYVLPVKLGIAKSNSIVAQWQKGSIPRGKTLEVLAAYFNVPTAYLLGMSAEKERTPAAVSDDDLKFALFGGDGEITDEMWQAVREYAEFVKEKYGKK